MSSATPMRHLRSRSKSCASKQPRAQPTVDNMYCGTALANDAPLQNSHRRYTSRLKPICMTLAIQKAAVRAARQSSSSAAGTAIAYMNSDTFIILKK